MKTIIIKYFEKNNKLSPPIKASLAFTIGDFLQRGIGLITIPIFTRILTEQTYGIVSVYNSWTGVLSIVVTFCLMNGGVVNNGMLDFEEDRETFISSLLSLIIFSTSIYYIVYKIFQNRVDNFLGLGEILMNIMIAGFILNSAISLWMIKEKYHYRYKLVIFVNFLYGIINPIITYYLITRTSLEQSFSRIVGGAIIPYIIGGVVAIYIFLKAKKLIKIKYWKYALKFNIPLLPHYLSLVILSQSDRIMIAKFEGIAKAGIYNLAYTISSIIMILFEAINSSFIPWTYKKMKEESYEEIGKQSKKIMILGSICSVLFIMCAPEVIKIMAPVSYHEAIYIIPPIVIGNYFLFIYNFFKNIEFYHKKTNYVMMASIIISIINIILNFIFIPFFGYLAAGYTTLIGYLGMCIIHYYVVKKIEKNKIYDIKFMIIISLSLILISFISLSLYDLTIIRYIIILMLFSILFIYKNKIVGILAQSF